MISIYVSAKSRKGTWGTSAIKFISEQLRRELLRLRGFSEESIKKMRTFSEFWSQYINRSPMATEISRIVRFWYTPYFASIRRRLFQVYR